MKDKYILYHRFSNLINFTVIFRLNTTWQSKPLRMIYFNYLLVVIPHRNKWYKYLFRIRHYCSQYNSFILFKLLPCRILDWNACSNNERPTKAHLKGAWIQSVVVVQVRKALAEFTQQHHQKCHWHISLREHNHPHKCWCRHLCSYAHSLTLRSLPLFTPGYPAHELWALWCHSRWK